MKAAPMTQKPSFPLMKQGDIQTIYHLQMPRWLFTDVRYKSLFLEAKVAYTFLLNRFQLSRLNGWVNDDGEVFIIYTRRSLAQEMQVSYRKIIEAMKALAAVGLIWERRCGRGDANQIYLALVDHSGGFSGESVPFVGPDHEAAGGVAAWPDDGGQEGPGITPKPAAEPRSAGSELLPSAACPDGNGTPTQEMPGQHLQICGDGTSRDAGPEFPEVPDRHPNYTESSQIDLIHTDVSLSAHTRQSAETLTDGRTIHEQEQLEMILERCELWIFEPEVALVLENAVERLFYSDSFRIGDAVLPQANVRSRLWNLDGTILQAVVGKLQRNQREIKNTTAYTMAVIFNAISESQSDILVDPYLNSLRKAAPGGGRHEEV